MIRKVILAGDILSSQGSLIAPAHPYLPTVDGRNMALIGGPVFCDACKSQGVIFKSGGPYRPSFNGLEAALEGDLVRCNCPKHPSLIATANMSWLPTADDQIDKYGPVLNYEQQFKLLDSNGNPMQNTYYSTVVPEQMLFHGVTDAAGMTERFSFSMAQSIQVHIGHIPSVANPAHMVTAIATTQPDSVVTAQSNRMAIDKLSMSAAGKSFLEAAEHTRLYYYDDNLGFCTAGTGHLVNGRTSCEHQGIQLLSPVSQQQVDAWLAEDLERTARVLKDEVHVPLHQQEYDALMSLTFNLGSLAHAPHLRQLVNSGQYEAAAHEMLDITNGGIDGLVTRRKNESDLYLHGNYVYRWPSRKHSIRHQQ